MQHVCSRCGTEANHSPTEVKWDGSGFSTCPDCGSVQVWTAGSFSTDAAAGVA